MWRPHDDLQPYIHRAGLYHVARVRPRQLDHALITVLVERWRLESCTFHLPVGEMTVTLEDVAVFLGLRVDGEPVTGGGLQQWDALCMELLGRVLEDLGTSSRIKFTWLRDNFRNLLEDATEIVRQRYARAYMFALLGNTLFIDSNGEDVHLMYLELLRDFDVAGRLSWGSGVLARLYRELYKRSLKIEGGFAGCLTLLQIWAWERLHIDRPSMASAHIVEHHDPLGCRWNFECKTTNNPMSVISFYRNQLDMLREEQTWTIGSSSGNKPS